MLGCGNWGKNLIRVFHQCGALQAVCDSDPKKAKSFSDDWDVPSLTLDEILGSPQIDAVAVATPSHTHESLIEKILYAKKHVFVEKPFTISAQSAYALSELAKAQGKILMVGHLLHYHPAFQMLKQLTREGALGKLQYVYSHRYNFGKFPSEANVMWDFAPHDVSMILSLMGTLPTTVMATGANYLKHTNLDHACLHLNFPMNQHAHVIVSWLHPYKEQKLIVAGDKAMAVFDDSQPWESKLRVSPLPPQWSDGLPHPFPGQFENVAVERSEPLLNECQHFLECLLEFRQPITNSVEGANVIAVLEAALQSMKLHQSVSLPTYTALETLTC